MSRGTVSKGVKLLQFFLAQDPQAFVYEVGIDKHEDVVCTCPVWSSKGSCKHSKFVIENMEDGDYLAELVGDPTDQELIEAETSDDKYRSFIIKYGKIEAL